MREWKKIRRQYIRFCKKYRRLTKALSAQIRIAGICIGLIVIIAAACLTFRGSKEEDVYAAAELQQSAEVPQISIPPGISGAIAGVQEAKAASDGIERIGTSCEQVIVGQRRKEIKSVRYIDASSALESRVTDLKNRADRECERAAMMSDVDYETLLAIVEAEAGGEDLKGRVMVANVILNRVKSNEFPDNVYDVVWERVDGMPQFTPTDDGRIESVSISDTTVKAVKAAIEGTDYSEGALFFVAKDQANEQYVKWFDKDLKRLCEHGVHTFYTYPE